MPLYSTKRCLDNTLLEVSTKGLKMKQSYNRSRYLLPLAIYVTWNELMVMGGESCGFFCLLFFLSICLPGWNRHWVKIVTMFFRQ